MEQIAMILVLLGAIACLVGAVGLLIDAFRESIFWGIGCLLFWPVVLAFVVFHWAEAKKAFLIWVAGFAAILLAGFLHSEPRSVQETAQEQEMQEIPEERPSNFKTIVIGIVVFILLGGIGVGLVKFLKDRSGGEITYDEEEEYVYEAEENPFNEIEELPTVQSLINDLEDEDPLVRENAARALGDTDDKQAIKPLAKALKDEEPAIRKAARESLIEVLTKILGGKEMSSRAMAAKLLGKIGDKRSIKPLAIALKNEDQTIRNAAKDGLALIRKRLGPEEWSKVVQKRT